MKPSTHHIWIPLYDKRITVVFVGAIDDATMPYIAKQLEMPLDALREIVIPGSEGLTLYNRSALWCALVFPMEGNTLSIESLSHECFHAAHRIASYVSIVFDFENAERHGVKVKILEMSNTFKSTHDVPDDVMETMKNRWESYEVVPPIKEKEK